MLTSYINQIKDFEILTKEQEIDLAKQIKKGNKKAFEKLINCNLKLVVSVAKKYSNLTIDIMDLIQEGNIALMNAAEKFNEKFHTRFSTYAYLWITQAIVRFIRNKVPMITIPSRKEIAIRKIKKAKETLTEISGHTPSTLEIATYLSIPEQQVKDSMENLFTVSSLDMNIGENSESTVEEFISKDYYNPDDFLFENEIKEEIEEMLNTLPTIEKDVVRCRFNFENTDDKTTLRAVGSKLGISSETVRKIEMRAINKLKCTVEEYGFYA